MTQIDHERFKVHVCQLRGQIVRAAPDAVPRKPVMHAPTAHVPPQRHHQPHQCPCGASDNPALACGLFGHAAHSTTGGKKKLCRSMSQMRPSPWKRRLVSAVRWSLLVDALVSASAALLTTFPWPVWTPAMGRGVAGRDGGPGDRAVARAAAGLFCSRGAVARSAQPAVGSPGSRSRCARPR